MGGAPKYREDPDVVAQRNEMKDKARQEAQKQSEESTVDLSQRRMGARGAQALFSAGYSGFPRTLGQANV
jgi:hypothetical protein